MPYGMNLPVTPYQTTFRRMLENQQEQQKLSSSQAEQSRAQNLLPYLIQKYKDEQATSQGAEKRAQTEEPLNLESLRAKIESEKSLADWRKKSPGYGQGSLGASAKIENFIQSLTQKEYPNLSPEQQYEASNVLRQKGNTLADGTQLNPPSPALQAAFDNQIKGTTYAGVATPLINAKQADAELDVLGGKSDQWLKESGYGDTINNMSPQQIVDTFKAFPESQDKLGKLIASQALQFEIAQIRNRIAMGQPGITSTQELMNASRNTIDAKFPMLSFAARHAASKYINEALKEGLKARSKVGIGASVALENKFKKSEQAGSGKKERNWEVHNGKLVEV